MFAPVFGSKNTITMMPYKEKADDFHLIISFLQLLAIVYLIYIYIYIKNTLLS